MSEHKLQVDAAENDNEMSAQERFKAYAAMAEISRKWVTVMDAKAAFLSGLNAALLTCMWAGLRFGSESGPCLLFALIASVVSALSMLQAVWVVLPRSTLSSALKTPMKYQGTLRPVSYYGFVANNYPAGKLEDFRSLVWSMDEEALARECLEQHYAISHVVAQKSSSVTHAGFFWFVALVLAVVAIWLKFT